MIPASILLNACSHFTAVPNNPDNQTWFHFSTMNNNNINNIDTACKVWVGNVPEDMDEVAIRKWLWGKNMGYPMYVALNGNPGRERWAMLRFKCQEDANRLLRLAGVKNALEWPNRRHLLIR